MPSNYLLDLTSRFVIMETRKRSLNFWGVRVGSNPLTNVFIDLSVREKMVSMPARVQDALSFFRRQTFV